jgi:hypothetical protein
MTNVLRGADAERRATTGTIRRISVARVLQALVLGACALSVGVAAAFGVVSVAVMALVLLGLVLARLVATPASLVALSGAVLLVAAWASVFDLYSRIGWLDLAVHASATGALAAVGTSALRRAGILSAPGSSSTLVLSTTALVVGLALGVLWEVGEWAGHTYVDDDIGVGYDDTIGDLVAGGAGAAVAGVLVARRRSTSRDATR